MAWTIFWQQFLGVAFQKSEFTLVPPVPNDTAETSCLIWSVNL